LQTAAAAATAEVERAHVAHDNTLRAEREAEAALTGIDTYNNWVSAQNNRLRQLQALATQANINADTLAPLMTAHRANEKDLAAALQSLWQSAETRLNAAVEESRVRAGVLRARIDTLRTALSELDSAQGQCPVCRRPLDAEDEQAARAQHEEDLSGLEAELATAEDNSYRADLAAVQANLRNLLPLMHRGDPAPTPAADHDTAQRALAEARTARGGALDAFLAARNSADAARDALQQASADDAADKHLIGLYQQEAAVLAAATATQQAVGTLMAQTVSPLADELDSRWKLLFADRGDVRLESGLLSREINGQSLSYDAFSEGEKAFAQVLLRLLVLDAATRAGFCWIDEPLEHLDPRTRRHVASMLARAVSSSNARQIVVTTYEEPLARRLALRYPDNVRVIYVRPEHPTAAS
jgi:DNA repair exonuclease SbcCD ATPase subunit